MVLFGGHVVLILRFNYTVWKQWYYNRCKQKENLVPPLVPNLLQVPVGTESKLLSVHVCYICMVPQVSGPRHGLTPDVLCPAVCEHWLAQGAARGLRPTLSPLRNRRAPCVGPQLPWQHCSEGHGPVAVPKAGGHAGSRRKAAVFEMPCGYHLNLQLLSSWQDIWHCPGECGAGIGAGCSFRKESDRVWENESEMWGDLLRDCRWWNESEPVYFRREKFLLLSPKPTTQLFQSLFLTGIFACWSWLVWFLIRKTYLGLALLRSSL